MFVIRPLKKPPLGLVPLAFAIFSIRSTTIPFASDRKSIVFCRDDLNPPRLLENWFNEFNPPENIELKNPCGLNCCSGCTACFILGIAC